MEIPYPSFCWTKICRYKKKTMKSEIIRIRNKAKPFSKVLQKCTQKVILASWT